MKSPTRSRTCNSNAPLQLVREFEWKVGVGVRPRGCPPVVSSARPKTEETGCHLHHSRKYALHSLVLYHIPRKKRLVTRRAIRPEMWYTDTS